MEINVESLREYLSQLLGAGLIITGVTTLGRSDKKPEEVLKAYGYGTPLRIDYSIGEDKRSLVLQTVRPGGFGHERMPDRAAILLWESMSFNELPRHVKALDVGAFVEDGSMKTLGDCVELFLLRELVEGTEYYRDLDRIRDKGVLKKIDLERCEALAEYLAGVHSAKRDEPGLYERRIRELIGHNECILGLTDSYPSNLDYIGTRQLSEIEKRCIDWRWRLKTLTHRLSQVHGDFHPWNVLFREGTDFTVLDRSRGEWGEPADDVATMAINYLFYALQHRRGLEGPFKELWGTFFGTYLEMTNDDKIMGVIPPFLCWRALVIASPIWYPNLAPEVRKALLNFARNVLEMDALDPDNVSDLLEAIR